MNTNQTNNDSLDFDFSSNGGGQVASLESFLETPINNDNNEPPIIDGDPPQPPITDGDPPKPNGADKNEPPIIDGDPPKPNGADNDEPAINIDLDEMVDDDKNKNADGSVNYNTIAKKLIESKVWEDVVFEVDGEEVTLDEMDLDEETFLELYNENLERERKSLLEGKVSTEGISDFTAKLIEIEKNGGNVQQAISSYQKFKHPLEGMDLSKESDQQAVLYLKYQAKGLEDKEIVDLISVHKQKGELESRATEAKQEIETAFDNHIEQINNQAQEQKNKRAEQLKNYRKSLSEKFNDFELKDNIKRKLVDIASKEDKEGGFELDNLYFKLRNNPETAAELVLFLTDRDEFVKQLTEKEKRATELNTMKKLKIVRKGTSNVKIDKDKDKGNNKNFIDLDKLS